MDLGTSAVIGGLPARLVVSTNHGVRLQDSKPKESSLVAWHARVRRRGARSNHFCE